MDLKKEILREHSKAQTTKIVAYVGTNAKRFNALVKVYLKGPYRVTQRASWPISVCVEYHPALIKPHLGKLLTFARKTGVHDAVKRSTLRLLQFIEIPKKYHGQIVDMCFTFLQDNKEPIAVKVFSMTVLSYLVKELPDLKNELILIINDKLPYSSAGFKSRARKVLVEIDTRSTY